jgi:hypothetical protein
VLLDLEQSREDNNKQTNKQTNRQQTNKQTNKQASKQASKLCTNVQTNKPNQTKPNQTKPNQTKPNQSQAWIKDEDPTIELGRTWKRLNGQKCDPGRCESRAKVVQYCTEVGDLRVTLLERWKMYELYLFRIDIWLMCRIKKCRLF